MPENRITLALGLLILTGMMLFPPFYATDTTGYRRENLGYHCLFIYDGGGTVFSHIDTTRLGVQVLLCIFLTGGIMCQLPGEKKETKPPPLP